MPTVTTSGLGRRLAVIEHREAVRRTMARYMDLCDVPQAGYAEAELASLFTPHAVWEGIGPEYIGKFGRLDGRESILSMLRTFLPPAPHFRTNVHLLGEGHITTQEGAATGRWIMQQISEYDGGERELIAARLDVDFEIIDATALISHFRTEKLFAGQSAAPVSAK